MSAMPQHHREFDLEATLTVVINDLGQIKGRLTSIDGRLEQVDSRLDRVDSRLDRVDSRLDRVDSRLDRIESDMVYVKAGVSALIDSVADLAKRVGKLEGR